MHRIGRNLFGFALVCCSSAVLLACSGGSVADGTGPVAPPRDTTTTPIVQRGTLTVQVTIDPQDGVTASTIGVTPAGLTVRLVRNLSADAPRTATTGSDGIARFDSLLEGSYQISVDRSLTSAETSRLPTADRDINVMAAGTSLIFAPPSRQVAVSLVASRRGSLVVSELFGYAGVTVPYNWGSYLEVFNASDTTIYLDGVLLAETWGGMHLADTDRPCETFNYAKRMDSTAIWVNLVWSFPGSGRDFPIRAGEAKVVAIDALNHAEAAPNMGNNDLSRADFEQHGSDADIDNPFVPDMVRVRGGPGFFGRGYPFSFGLAYVLTLPSAIRQLEPGTLDVLAGGEFPVYRVSRDQILDVAGILGTVESLVATGYYSGGGRDCRSPFMSPVFERDPSQIAEYTIPKAIARKSLGRTASGVELLQRTRTSSRDFEYAEPLRRSLRKP